MKRIGLILVVLVSVVGILQANVTTFTEDFEGYDDGTVTPSPNWNGGSSTFSSAVKVDPVAHDGTKVYKFYREDSLNQGASVSINTVVSVRHDDAPGVYIITGWAYIGNSTPNGSGQVSSKLAFWTRDADYDIGTWVGFSTTRYNRDRTIEWYDGDTYNSVSVGFNVDVWMKVVTVIDEINNKWSFEITDANGALLLSKSDLSFRSNYDRFERVSVYGQTNSRNDGQNNRVDSISVEWVPEPATGCLIIALGTLGLIRKR